MAERTCCKTCQKKGGCAKVCLLESNVYYDCRCGWACSNYEEIPVPASSKPRIVAV